MRKLLIIHQGALGDVVLTFPALIRLREKFSVIQAICQGKIGRLACELGVVDSCFPLEAATVSSLYTKSVAPDVQKILAACDESLAFSRSEQLNASMSRTTDHPLHVIPPRPDPHCPIHVTDHVLSHLTTCGLLEDGEISHTDRRYSGYDPAKILIHPGSGSRRKNWPLSNFVQIGRALKKTGLKPEFILGPAEHFLAVSLENDHGTIIHTLSDPVELLFLLRNAGGFIGNDSGVTHLAAFVGLPTIAIFGPSDPRRWRPLGRSVKVIRQDGLYCTPCFETRKTNCDQPECLDSISPDRVQKWIGSGEE